MPRDESWVNVDDPFSCDGGTDKVILSHRMTVRLVCPKCEAQNNFEVESPIPLSKQLVCPSCSTAFSSSIVTIRAKRGHNRPGSPGREYSVRVTNDAGTERLIEFVNSSAADIELRSKDVVVFSYLNNELRVVQNFTINQYYKVSKPQCYLATHVYGPSSWEVELLRQFRDETLLASPIGARCVTLYYRSSPWLILRLGDRWLVTQIIRSLVKGVVWVLRRCLADQRF